MHGATSLTDNKPATSMFLAVIPKSSTVEQNVNLSAFINVQGATGTVTFLDGGNSIGASRLNGSGNSVRLSTKALGVGDHPLTASTRATRITTQSPAV
jgi:Bacterial Ig-like domain (group 3)